MKPAISSLYQAIELIQEIPPLIIGERANVNGSKRFREYLLADDFEGCLKIGVDQEEAGAQVIDLCAAYAGRDEMEDLLKLMKKFSSSLRAGLMIDSTTPACIEACLEIYPGRPIVNSVNLEDGGVNLERILQAVKKHGAAVVALTIDEKGMAMTAGDKVDVARRIYEIATNRFGLRACDLLFDPLTFTIGSGDEKLADAAIETLEAIRRIKEELPGTLTILGVSNISFGLKGNARPILNSLFLHEAVKKGLDAAIVDAGGIIPFGKISEEERNLCLDLLYNRKRAAGISPLESFIKYFEENPEEMEEMEGEKAGSIPEEELKLKVIGGERDGLEDLLEILLSRHGAVEIINQILVPAMRQVGDLFGKGELLLPFVLKSAEVMKKSVKQLEPYMERKEEEVDKTSILLATVQGDVHDIGKNLVDIILSNNGYRVHNLGIKIPAERIIEEAGRLNVDVIGLSGLLVKSAMIMEESMPQYRESGLRVPILLGGAALTEKFVAQSCAPNYEGSVVYCADAFAGLSAIREYEEGRLTSTTHDPSSEKTKGKPGVRDSSIIRTNPVPEPPFTGKRYLTSIDPGALFSYLNEEALIRGRWGYRRGNMGKEEYEEMIEGEVRPLLDKLKNRCLAGELLEPRVAYGYFPCFRHDDSLIVQYQAGDAIFQFPRQDFPPHLCISDYFKSREEGGDIVGFFVVTIGHRISRETEALFSGDSYHDYVTLHGFGVEITDALAEFTHEKMREELGMEGEKSLSSHGYVTQQYQGSRYGFGYPSCPDLEAQEIVFQLLDPGEIGVTLTESMMMVPEQSTSAIVAHHPQAKYFAV